VKSINCGLRISDGGPGRVTPDCFAPAQSRISLGRIAGFPLRLSVMLLAAFPSQAYAQGCAMCLASAMSQGVRAIEAMNLGILILLVPPFLMILAVFTFLFLRRS
jgi:hypothetical protein